jgi:hypothetical protein
MKRAAITPTAQIKLFFIFISNNKQSNFSKTIFIHLKLKMSQNSER